MRLTICRYTNFEPAGTRAEASQIGQPLFPNILECNLLTPPDRPSKTPLSAAARGSTHLLPDERPRPAVSHTQRQRLVC